MTVHVTARAEVVQLKMIDGGTVENVADRAAIAGCCRRDPTYNSDADPSSSVIKHVKTALGQTEPVVNSLDRLAFSEELSTNVPQVSCTVVSLILAAGPLTTEIPDGAIHATVEVAPPTHTGPRLESMTVSPFKMNVPFT